MSADAQDRSVTTEPPAASPPRQCGGTPELAKASPGDDVSILRSTDIYILHLQGAVSYALMENTIDGGDSSHNESDPFFFPSLPSIPLFDQAFDHPSVPTMPPAWPPRAA